MLQMTLDACEPFVHDLDHPEGVAWGPDGFVYAGGEAGQIYRITLDGTKTQIASTNGFVLGLCLDADANIYACDPKNCAVMRVTPRGGISVYSSGTTERPMVTPNYPVFDARGNLYVSDSGHWLKDDGCIYCIRTDGRTEVISNAPRFFPNGMALSPDNRWLYVVLSTTTPSVVRMQIGSDQRLGRLEPVITLPMTVPDGVACDEAGNLYISCYTPNRVYRLCSSGELSVFVEDWQAITIAAPANVAFCGPDLRTLVISSLSLRHLTKVAVDIAGSPLHYPTLGK